jgi:hypothetical protein
MWEYVKDSALILKQIPEEPHIEVFGLMPQGVLRKEDTWNPVSIAIYSSTPSLQHSITL